MSMSPCLSVAGHPATAGPRPLTEDSCQLHARGGREESSERLPTPHARRQVHRTARVAAERVLAGRIVTAV